MHRGGLRPGGPRSGYSGGRGRRRAGRVGSRDSVPGSSVPPSRPPRVRRAPAHRAILVGRRPRLGWIAVRRTVALALLLFLSLAVPAMGAARHPLETAFLDPAAFGGPEADLAFARASDAGTTVVRLQLIWSVTAPARRPKGFDPTDPADPAYRFAALDEQVRRAVRARPRPDRVHRDGAPVGVRERPRLPAAEPEGVRRLRARRGPPVQRHFEGLPRVRFWQVWNEPNKVAGPALKASAPDWYREMVRSFAAAVHRVHARQRRRRRRARAVRQVDRGRAARLHAPAPLHVEGGHAEADVQGDDAVRDLVDAPVHRRRADAQGDPGATTCRSATCRR